MSKIEISKKCFLNAIAVATITVMNQTLTPLLFSVFSNEIAQAAKQKETDWKWWGFPGYYSIPHTSYTDYWRTWSTDVSVHAEAPLLLLN